MSDNPRDRQLGGVIDVKWIDKGREPQCPPNPMFPNGVDVDVSGGQRPACQADLPYPAKRCGLYVVSCETCGLKVAVTTAGRPDDPRSVTMPCKSSDGGP